VRSRLLRPRAIRLFLMAATVLSLSLGAIPQEVAAHSLLPGYSLFEINGVKVYFRKPPSEERAQLAQIGAIMMAGIGNQEPDEAHCAHMAEHMVCMYPGPSGESVWSISAKDYQLGSPLPLNGHVSLDTTEWAVSAAHSDTLRVLTALLGSMFRSTLESDEAFKTEIKRARREVDAMTGSDITALANKMKASAFHGTRYYETLFETPLPEVTAEKIRGFIEREYTPARLTLIIAADVDESELLNHIARCLVGIDPGRGPADHSDVYLDPPSQATLEVGAKKQYAGLAVGISRILPEDRPTVLALLNILTRRLYAVPQTGSIRFLRDLHTIFVAQSALVATYGYTDARGSDMSSEVQRYQEALSSILASLASDGPSMEELSYYVIPGTPRVSVDLSSIPYAGASQTVSTLLYNGLMETSIWDRAEAYPEETRKILKAAAAKYLPNAKITVVYQKQPSNSGTVLGLSIAALTACIALGVFFWRRATV
jgi:predicted Zn-dependent peptidase